MYTFAHPIEDALENITHSICTLEFEDQRPFYDWLLGHLAAGGLINSPPPHQYEFARLNLTYVVTSKRKLAQLVNEKHVQGWDDPRMPTLVGLRRRGYTPEAIKLFCERIGVTKADSWIDYSTLEAALRDTLDPIAARAMAVLNPVKLVITNFESMVFEDCSAPVNPHNEAQGKRSFQFGRELWIEADDFQAVPEKGFFRLTPPINGALGSRVRLKYGFVVECTGFQQDATGKVTQVHATYFPDSKSGSATSGNYKVKGVIGWVAAHDALSAEVRLYDRLFSEAQPDAGGKDFLTALNVNSLTTVQAYVEPSLASTTAGDAFQFERLGYFVADRMDSTAGKLVFNRAVGLKDGWGK
jgi:glutaminyl-tRNA synthetase